MNIVSEIINCHSCLINFNDRGFPVYELEDWIEQSDCIFDLSGMSLDNHNWVVIPGVCYPNCFYSFYDGLLFSRDRSVLLYDRKMNILQSSVCAFALHKANLDVIQTPIDLDDLEQVKAIIGEWI
jgi:hypothetical protein